MKAPKGLIKLLAAILVIMITIGTTYAFFSATITGSESSQTISLTGGTLTIAVDGGNSINIPNISPSYDPIITKTITLTGTNTTNLFAPYTMSLVIESNTLSNNAISYTLESINTSSNGKVIPSITENTGISSGSNTIPLGSGGYNNGSSLEHTYHLRIYFLETETDQSIDQGKNISGYVKVESGEVFIVPPAPEGWFESTDGTLLKAIKNHNTVTSPGTIPGRQISTSEEAVLAATEDDYGTSYYFRGAVENNYVVFANMCWRIVRVVGDG